MKSFLIVVLVISVNYSYSQTLTGSAPQFSNKTISVFEYEDFFTDTRIEKFNTVLDAEGEFSFDYPVSSPLYIEILFANSYSGVYVQPGFEYKLHFDSTGKIVAILSKDPTNLIIKGFDTKDYALFEFQKKKKSYGTKIKEFVDRQKSMLDSLPEFAKQIISYRLSGRELRVYFDSADTVALKEYEQKMFLTGDIKSNYPDYYSALKRFYYDRADHLRVRKRVFDSNRPFQSMLAEMEYIPSDSIRDLAYLTGLIEAYKKPWAPPQKRINHLLDSIKDVTKNQKVRTAALLLKRRMNALEPGKQIEDFSFDSYRGERYTLSSLKGKYILIDFWFIGCSECVKSFPNLKKIKEAAKGKLEIVSLTPSDTKERIDAFLKKRPQFDWIFSPIDNKGDTMDYFNITGFPTYFLIGPDGSLIKAFELMSTEKELREVIELIDQ